jgi:hypothetical protein
VISTPRNVVGNSKPQQRIYFFFASFSPRILGKRLNLPISRFDHLVEETIDCEPMTTSELIAAIDSEIARLKQVSSLLSGIETRKGVQGAIYRRGKRTLSAAARARISAAQKKRWAQQKRAAKR